MAIWLDRLSGCIGFEWDEGNAEKNWIKHRVGRSECEEAFFNEPIFAASDVERSGVEPRFYALGQTDEGRLLFLAFTVRGPLIRVISARDMSRRERKEYERGQSQTEDPKASQS